MSNIVRMIILTTRRCMRYTTINPIISSMALVAVDGLRMGGFLHCGSVARVVEHNGAVGALVSLGTVDEAVWSGLLGTGASSPTSMLVSSATTAATAWVGSLCFGGDSCSVGLLRG